MLLPNLSWLVGFAVQFVENLLKDGLDFRDVCAIVILDNIVVRQSVQLVFQFLDFGRV